MREPPWLWLGGIMGAVIVAGITYSPARIGVFATIGLLIAGQLVMGAFIDAFGLFGVEKIPLGAARIGGLALLSGGAVRRSARALSHRPSGFPRASCLCSRRRPSSNSRYMSSAVRQVDADEPGLQPRGDALAARRVANSS